MARTYYQIELTARQLSLVLGGLALLVAVSFALGYGAAWSVLAGQPPVREAPPVLAAGSPTPEPTPPEVELPVVVAEATAPAAPAATAVPTGTPTPAASAPTSVPEPTSVPAPTPTAVPTAAPPVPASYWVQILAAGDHASILRAQARLEELQFGPDHQWLLAPEGGNRLWRLRVGPFPDRASADRVARRMQASDFSGAWVVGP